jgi:hypothetical protein
LLFSQGTVTTIFIVIKIINVSQISLSSQQLPTTVIKNTAHINRMTKQGGLAVMLKIWILEARRSNLNCNTNYLEVFVLFLSSPEKCHDSNLDLAMVTSFQIVSN